ncbi:MAG: hypothetical protein N2645_05300 [Clostridia bacterium]|nr:hypothetical protein [Clostridia bacterium]
MKCDFCGFEFEKDNCKTGCGGCPMNKSCGKIKCPNCNYEMLPTPELKTVKSFAKLIKKVFSNG